jgi:hypothetical protein
MHRRTLVLVVIATLAASPIGYRIYAQDRSDHALIKGVTDAKVTLQQGLTTAAAQGRPISGKFEVEDGKLQLSVHSKGWKVFRSDRRSHDRECRQG